MSKPSADPFYIKFSQREPSAWPLGIICHVVTVGRNKKKYVGKQEKKRLWFEHDGSISLPVPPSFSPFPPSLPCRISLPFPLLLPHALSLSLPYLSPYFVDNIAAKICLATYQLTWETGETLIEFSLDHSFYEDSHKCCFGQIGQNWASRSTCRPTSQMLTTFRPWIDRPNPQWIPSTRSFWCLIRIRGLSSVIKDFEGPPRPMKCPTPFRNRGMVIAPSPLAGQWQHNYG